MRDALAHLTVMGEALSKVQAVVQERTNRKPRQTR